MPQWTSSTAARFVYATNDFGDGRIYTPLLPGAAENLKGNTGDVTFRFTCALVCVRLPYRGHLKNNAHFRRYHNKF